MSAFVGSHLDLCRDLAQYLSDRSYRTWVEIKRVGQMTYGDRGRIDVLALTPWTGKTKFEFIAFEVKVGRRDLQHDVQSGKWRRYVTEYGMPRVVFAFPEGIAEEADIPTDAGIFIRRASGWVRKRAPKSLEHDQRKIDPLLLLSLLSTKPYGSEKHERIARIHRLLPKEIAERLSQVDDVTLYDAIAYSDVGKAIGHELGKRLAKPPKAIEAISKAADALIAALAQMRGVPEEEIRTELECGEYSGILKGVRDGVRLAANLEAIGRIGSALSSLRWGGREIDMENALKLVNEVEQQASSKKRRVA